LASWHILASVWASFYIFFVDTSFFIFCYCHIRELVTFVCFSSFIDIEFLFICLSFRIKINIIRLIALAWSNIWLIVWVCYFWLCWIGLILLCWIGLIILEIDILTFNIWNEHIFSNLKHCEWCHIIILINRFHQSWKVFQLIDIRLHELWLSIDQYLQLIFSFIDLVEDLILVSCLKSLD